MTVKTPVPAETLLFLHIGRTAGTTLSSIVSRQFPAAYRYSFDSADMQRSIETFASLPLQERAKIRLLSGHFPYGLHELVPGPATYITMLRDPVDRILSIYSYMKIRKDHRLHSQVHSLSLKEFLRSRLTTEVDNGQVRSIANALDIPYGALNPDTLTLAQQHLDSFAVCGLTEHFDETIIMLRRRFAWRRLTYAPKNAISRISRSQLDREELLMVEAHAVMDQALYDEQRRRLAITWRQPDFEREVRQYQRRNRIQGSIHLPAAWRHNYLSRRSQQR